MHFPTPARTTTLAFATLAAFLAFAGSASAQEEPIIIDQEITGYYIGVGGGFFGTDFPLPGVPGVVVGTPAQHVPVPGGGIPAIQACTVDDPVQDTLACEAVVEGNVTVPCKTAAGTLEANEATAPAAGTIRGATMTLDAALEAIVGPTVGSLVPVQNVHWGTTATDAVFDCDVGVPQTITSLGTPPITIEPFLDNDPVVCFAVVCPGENGTIPLRQTVVGLNQTIAGYQNTSASPSCGTRGLIVDCGEYELPDGTRISPREISETAVGNIPGEHEFTEDVSLEALATERVTIDDRSFNSGTLLRCTWGGQGPMPGALEVVPYPRVEFIPTGGSDLNESVQQKLDALAATWSRDVSTLTYEVLEQWYGTGDGISSDDLPALGPLPVGLIDEVDIPYVNPLLVELSLTLGRELAGVAPLLEQQLGPYSPIHPAQEATEEPCSSSGLPADPGNPGIHYGDD